MSQRGARSEPHSFPFTKGYLAFNGIYIQHHGWVTLLYCDRSCTRMASVKSCPAHRSRHRRWQVTAQKADERHMPRKISEFEHLNTCLNTFQLACFRRMCHISPFQMSPVSARCTFCAPDMILSRPLSYMIDSISVIHS